MYTQFIMCTFMCVYIHVYVYIYMCMCVRSHVCVHSGVMFVYVHLYVYVRSCIHDMGGGSRGARGAMAPSDF